MSFLSSLESRSGSKCELCLNAENLGVYPVPPRGDSGIENEANSVLLCVVCLNQLTIEFDSSSPHWHKLSETMWTQHAPVQVLIRRVLTALKIQGWAQDLLDQLYLPEDLQSWADEETIGSVDAGQAGDLQVTLDSNGVELSDGDSVTLIKDLEVKGGGFTAKRGTLVKGITLTGDPGLIEGKVNGSTIVLKTCFLKKA